MEKNFKGEHVKTSIQKVDSRQYRKSFNYTKEKGIPYLFEIELLHAIRHPYLLYGEGIEIKNGMVNLYLPAADYDLEKKKFSPAELINFFYQISLALQALHEHSIAHFDVKPENILIFQKEGKSIAKLADFGLSRYIPGYHLGYPFGTPFYFPPEFLLAVRDDFRVELDINADVWSLGLTFYLLISQDYDFDLDEKRNILPIIDYIKKVFLVWILDPNKVHLKNKIKDPSFVEIFANMLTSAEKRWSINQVVSHLEKIIVPEPRYNLITASSIELPKIFREKIDAYLDYLRVNADHIIYWINRFYPRLSLNDVDEDEIAFVLIYIAITFIGHHPSIEKYINIFNHAITVQHFLDIEILIVKQLYPESTEKQKERQSRKIRLNELRKPEILEEKKERANLVSVVENLSFVAEANQEK